MRRRRRGGKPRVFTFLIFFTIIAVTGIVMAERQFAPVIKSLAYQKAHMVALKAMQEAAQRQIRHSDELQNYQELMHIEKDSTGRIILMVPNTMKINLLVSDIVLDAEEAMSQIGKDELKIPLGVITGSKILAALGPAVNVRAIPVSMVHIQVRDEFISAGINQTHHRIWLEMETSLTLAVPFDREELLVNTQILLSEGIIVGPIPDTYVNFGLSR